MGGADRRERQRRQEAAQARLRAAGITPKRGGLSGNALVLTIVAVVVIAAIVIGVTITLKNRSAAAAGPAATYPVSRSGVVVAAGQASAPVTVDVYEDYLCPYCERLETTYKDQITTALNAGQIKVNYHAVTILDTRTTPAGYSTRAANAALCAVDATIWPQYHAALYAAQPAEGSAGLTNDQLTKTGTDLGAPASFGQCVAANGNAAAITAATKAAEQTPALQTDGSFGTPTVTVNGTKVDLNNSNWLQGAIKK
ncbi:hypothetical protein GCM10009836_23920 [Pseudonocardia ailaonensis]|uniref:Thioredoxin-like fold domain-containing protein n=1 Tax=Pseudonocardia ailaonensis TaxID=367279 RepID=A0ABN2MY04_9PSEU